MIRDNPGEMIYGVCIHGNNCYKTKELITLSTYLGIDTLNYMEFV